ncbi:hypothetical protein CDL12_18005 [Handroanthus impetiginosus]|uniref:Myb/SANT-like domain-containing protein n=1 Tax=Handroanthus impetiginosus TaxID=429701 RepID=A0A2G9GVW6_9LAMI|nr:hypothetical protein CDL12_18005 [Handroanthus impetiginosus]
MMSRSRFGWNDSTNMIVVEESIWEKHVKVDPNARTMHFKSFPFYLLWCDIFGKDRATGEHAQDCHDTAKSLLNNNNVATNDYVPRGFDTDFQIFGDEDEFISICQPKGSAMKSISTSKKRKSTETSTDDKIGDEYDTSEARKLFCLPNDARVEMVRMMLSGPS